ncbi:hypothetical protein KEM48_008865 [Puccinia striiformis f. sp. tritici PST-130]|nr:hypothetical protein KEM48_008865 [Puccinia striiformis f. sp. tritici PST-130]
MDVSPEDDWKLTMDANEKQNRFTSCVLRTQATCLAWSSAFSHSINSGNHSHDFYDVDFPLLAIGHRRGDISLWRHTSNGQMELESLNPVCPNGHTINLLSWSNWKLSARPRVDLASATQYQLTAYLAVANSKGVVYLLKIYRPFERPTKPLLPTSHIKIETVGVYQDPLNQSSITYLKWLPSIGNTSSGLVFSRLGEIVLLPLPSTADCQSSASLLDCAQAIQLPVLHSYDDRLCWADCNSWASCSEISTIPTGIPGHTSIIAMLSNGLIFVIKERIDTSDPSASNSVEIDLEHSIQLSLDFRGKFRMIGFSAHPPPNNVAITKLNVMSVFGSSVLSSLHHLSNDQDHQIHSSDQIALSSGSIMSWLYEIDAPNKFRYKPENYQILQFCLADFSPVGKVDHDPIKPERRTRLLGMLKEENRTPAQNVLLVHLYGGLKVALDLLQTLCSSSALLDSPHTVLLQSWKDLVDPPFDAPGLLISMRVRILADIQRLWRAEWPNTSPPNVVRGVVKILLDIIKANGEASPEPAAVGSFMAGYMLGTTNTSLDRIAGALTGGVGGMPGSSYMASYALSGGRAPAVPDESRIASLVDMGFPRSACETALARTHNNLNLATEFLLASPVLVQRARDEEATAATAAAAAPSASTDQPAATEEPSTSEEIDQTPNVIDSAQDESPAIVDEVMVTPRQSSVSAPALSIPSASNELASDTNDVSMGKASAEEPGTVEAQGSTENCSFSGDDGHTTPKIPSAEVNDQASSKTS